MVNNYATKKWIDPLGLTSDVAASVGGKLWVRRPWIGSCPGLEMSLLVGGTRRKSSGAGSGAGGGPRLAGLVCRSISVKINQLS